MPGHRPSAMAIARVRPDFGVDIGEIRDPLEIRQNLRLRCHVGGKSLSLVSKASDTSPLSNAAAPMVATMASSVAGSASSVRLPGSDEHGSEQSGFRGCGQREPEGHFAMGPCVSM